MIGRAAARASIAAWFALAAWGCRGASGDCERPGPAYERDVCLHAQIGGLGAGELGLVYAVASEIDDDVVRGAAVNGWVEAHVGEIPQQEGRALCELLSGPQQTYCARRLHSVHLRR